MSKNLDIEIIISDHQDNYVGNSSIKSNAAENFFILVISFVCEWVWV